MDAKPPFRILSLEEFQALTLEERVEYMRQILNDVHQKILDDKELVERSKQRPDDET